MAMNSRRVVPQAAAGLAMAAIVIATLTPHRDLVDAAQAPRIGGEPFQLADFVRNLILFMPLGASLVWARLPALRALGLVALLSAGIEVAQGTIPIAGRNASEVDLIANISGAALAIALFRSASAWIHPSPLQSRRLALVAGTVTAGVLVGTGLLLAPAPTTAVYFGHRTPSLAHLAPYRGTVLDAWINEVEISQGWLSMSDRIRARLAGDYTLRVQAQSGSPPEGVAGLLLITDLAQNEILLLGPDREDLVFRFRTRGRAVGLEPATVRLPGELAEIALGQTLDLRVERSAADLCITVDRGPKCGYGFSVGDGWRLLAPDYRIMSVWRPALDVVWLASLFFPIGFWGRRDGVSWTAGAIAVAALLLAPFVAPLRPTPVSQMAGAGFGAVLGIAARLRFAAHPIPERGN